MQNLSYSFQDYFRDPGSGNCLRCSECPTERSNQIVGECVNTVGRRKNQVQKKCWPGSSDFFNEISLSETFSSTGKFIVALPWIILFNEYLYFRPYGKIKMKKNIV